ncbi:hypothetical protein GE09DRAFT_630339 [Coniochaeta sp. 2T2.1]|nr:hypothetical protein GE09DRAFT_630339 [Coniochaeta sp. 2T2.1]
MPEEFQAVITPRSEARAQRIRQDWKDCQTLLDEGMQWKEVPKGMVFSSTAYDLDPLKYKLPRRRRKKMPAPSLSAMTNHADLWSCALAGIWWTW